MKYNNHLNYRDRRRLLIRLRIIYAIIFLVIVAGAVYFYIYYARDKVVNQNNISEKTNSVVAPTINTFRTSFFQFQASNTWVEVPKETTKNRFVYRSYKENLLEHEITIYVNETPNQNSLRINRVLPVTISESDEGVSRFAPEDVSESCAKALDKNAIPPDVQNVTFKKVSFLCYGNINQYNVIVGEVGNNANMTLKRSDGSSAVYSIFYKDLRAINGPSEIMRIASSFQSL